MISECHSRVHLYQLADKEKTPISLNRDLQVHFKEKKRFYQFPAVGMFLFIFYPKIDEHLVGHNITNTLNFNQGLMGSSKASWISCGERYFTNKFEMNYVRFEAYSEDHPDIKNRDGYMNQFLFYHVQKHCCYICNKEIFTQEEEDFIKVLFHINKIQGVVAGLQQLEFQVDYDLFEPLDNLIF